MNTVFAQFGLRRTTFSTLALVVDNPGLRQSQLAEALAIERPNLVKIVDELERSKLVRREVAAGDRRAYAIQATSAGSKLFKKAMRVVRTADQRLISGLSPDQIEALHDALTTIDANAKLSKAPDDV
jgi:DNA-binding MarR family transcriptional regulator